MLNYALPMKDKTIPWEIIEERLNALGRTRGWFEEKMGVEKNVVTNWKSRGVPKGKAADVGEVLQTTADFLLGLSPLNQSHKVSEHKKEGAIDNIPLDFIDGADIAKLVDLFRKSTLDGRVHILEAAEIAEKIVIGRRGRPSNNQA